MSLIGVKDLDLLLSKKLDEKSLLCLSHTNKYYYSIFNDKFCSNRYYQKYSIPDNLIRPIDKKIYFENENALIKPEAGLKFAIINDRAELLFLILSPPTISYINIDLMIENDSINCFKHLDVSYCNHFPTNAIRYKSNKILRHLFNQGLIKEEAQNIYNCFMQNSPEYIKLLNITNEIADEVIDLLSYSVDDITCLYETYNESFSLFISAFSSDHIKDVRNLALERERYKIIKLVTVYRSPFSDFSKK